ncbi:toxin TcdB middle/N-terminal domain-containing protein [Streptomyces sp. L7]
MRYLDLLAGKKPFLLIKVANNLGAETELEYTPSTSFYLADRRNGRPWVTRLPFPVPCPDPVDHPGSDQRQRILYPVVPTTTATTTGSEREFRGFGMVEQWDAEKIADAATDLPPVRTRTWFHTGYFAARDHVSDYYAGLLDATDTGEYYRELRPQRRAGPHPAARRHRAPRQPHFGRGTRSLPAALAAVPCVRQESTRHDDSTTHADLALHSDPSRISPSRRAATSRSQSACRSSSRTPERRSTTTTSAIRPTRAPHVR